MCLCVVVHPDETKRKMYIAQCIEEKIYIRQKKKNHHGQEVNLVQNIWDSVGKFNWRWILCKAVFILTVSVVNKAQYTNATYTNMNMVWYCMKVTRFFDRCFFHPYLKSWFGKFCRMKKELISQTKTYTNIADII